jgi:hypothetical protein
MEKGSPCGKQEIVGIKENHYPKRGQLYFPLDLDNMCYLLW